MFRRPFRGGGRAAMRPNPVLVQAIRRANQMIANGQASEAAQMLTRLVQESESRGRPRLTANLHAQAARAYAAAKDEQNALSHARSALNQFVQLDMLPRLPQFYANITRELRANGMNASADALQKEFGDKAKEFESKGFAAPSQHGRLPGKCPQCAAPVRSDEVDWIDRNTAECNYCGSVIQTE
ncbi:MAG: hypothetical protein KGJ80_13900 [Chloroflexota bacterium]|nr:hypothetical protein [Chloroflexota bacterium]